MHDGSPCILVVDDNPAHLWIAQINLQASGYEVLLAANELMAIEVVSCERPDLVILETEMPIVDGYETCRHIRTFSSVPIIMLSTMSSIDDRVRGLDAGADYYLSKPFCAGELLARIRALLRRVELSHQAQLFAALGHTMQIHPSSFTYRRD